VKPARDAHSAPSRDVIPARSWIRWLALIGALALILRGTCLAELRGSPLLSVLLGDAQQYDTWALRLAAGDWIGDQVFYQSPLYPYLLGVVYATVGHSVMTVRVLQVLLGAASCVLLAIAVRRFAGARAGLAAGLLLAVYAPAVFFDVLVQKSSVDLFLVVLFLALCGRFLERRHWRWLVGAGLAFGALTLNRENARVLLPVVIGWLWLGVRPAAARARVAWTGAFVLAASVVVLPVGFRNRAIGGEFLISTSQMGPNFYIGNHAGAKGSYEPLVEGRANASFEREDATRLAERATGRTLSPGEVSDYWLGQALDFIRREPLSWLALTGRKLLLAVDAGEAVDTESLEAYAQASRVLRGVSWLDFGVLFALAALGVCVTRDRWPEIGLAAASAAALALSLAVFYVFARYRYPVIPFVLVFAGAGLARLATRGAFRQRDVRLGASLAVGALLVSHVSIAVGRDGTSVNVGSALLAAGRRAESLPYLEEGAATLPDYFPARYYLGLALSQTGDLPRAIQEFDAALRLSPGDYDAHAAIGAALEKQGDTAGALAHLTEAVRIRPESPEGCWNLGLARLKAGDPAGAREMFLNVLRLKQESFAVRMGLGTACFDAGRLDESADHFTRAVALSPGAVNAMCSLARTLAALGRLPEAEAELEKALTRARATDDRAMIPQIEVALQACRNRLRGHPLR
jgi:tetratricopeptide (TPR) repeat protein